MRRRTMLIYAHASQTHATGLRPRCISFIIAGLLLPCLTVCLFLCINDPFTMPAPPRRLNNALVLICVALTTFLASHLVLDELATFIGDVEADGQRGSGSGGGGGAGNGAGNGTGAGVSGNLAWDEDTSLVAAGGMAAIVSIAVVLTVVLKARARARRGSASISGSTYGSAGSTAGGRPKALDG